TKVYRLRRPKLILLEQENLVAQPEEVPDIHRTLVEIESPVLYWWGCIRSCRNRIGYKA
nr:hypothetical protein [Tanacetum cinerariifolium]